MFPLLQLPPSCIQNVADQWKTVELYEFSLLSKRAKEISKKKKTHNLILHVDFYYRLLSFSEDGEFGSNMKFEKNRFIDGGNRIPLIDTDIILFVQAIQNFLDITNCQLDEFRLYLKPPWTVDQLIMTIDWLNEMKNEFDRVSIDTETWEMFEIFLNRFRKNIHTLLLYGEDIEWDGTVKQKLNFEVKDLSSLIDCPWFHLDFLFTMELESISADNIGMSAQDLNVFLRSWQEGKTNRNLEMADFVKRTEIDVKEVVKGCGGVLMDPRTSKVMFNHKVAGRIWMRGGIHIRRNDGRLAVVDTNGFDYWMDDDDVTEEDVNRYLKNLEIWNSDDVWMGTLLYFYVI
uniref:F-box domain-containing protein n=1 Tax=Caenorhabditis tropicalis TaxID=1561998 RepID=A0A1I7T4P8_9PELO